MALMFAGFRISLRHGQMGGFATKRECALKRGHSELTDKCWTAAM